MEEKEFDELKERIAAAIHKCHMAALKGLAPHETIRQIAARLEIKYAEKHEKRAKHDIEDLREKIQEHFVAEAEKAESKLVKEVILAVKDIYLAVFNIMIFEKVEVLKLDHFVEHVLKSNKLPAELKKMIADSVLPLVKEWHDSMKDLHKGANAVYASAKDRTTTSLGLTKLMHTQGPSYIKRKQEMNQVKDGHKDAAKSADLEDDIYKMHFKDKDDAQKKLDKFRKLQEESLADYGKAVRLLFVDWEETVKYLSDAGLEVEKAVGEHELPTLDQKQMEELRGLIIEKVMEPFVHSINEGVNQLDRIRNEVEDTAQKLEKKAA